MQNKFGNLEKIAILRQYKQPVFPGSTGSAVSCWSCKQMKNKFGN